MPLNGTLYSYGYNHQRKEVIIKFQMGTSPPVEIVTGAEAFIQDLDFIKKDQKLAHFISEVRKRKELPVTFDFGASSEIKFNPEDWNKLMNDEPEKS